MNQTYIKLCDKNILKRYFCIKIIPLPRINLLSIINLSFRSPHKVQSFKTTIDDAYTDVQKVFKPKDNIKD